MRAVRFVFAAGNAVVRVGNGLVRVASWSVRVTADRYDQWRINRWLRLRRAGVPLDRALRKAWLSPGSALAILNRCLDGNLETVGLIYHHRSGLRFRTAMNENQLADLLAAMLDLSVALPDDDRRATWSRVSALGDDDRGFVRRAALVATRLLPPVPS